MGVWGVVLVVCVCVGVGGVVGVVPSWCVCVCDLSIFYKSVEVKEYRVKAKPRFGLYKIFVLFEAVVQESIRFFAHTPVVGHPTPPTLHRSHYCAI